MFWESSLAHRGQVGGENSGSISFMVISIGKISGKFDLIIQYAVLEHLENPENYLDSLRIILHLRVK
jgi:2-polyprenyl-3-methyl-5-hydroxy-6-metoxy-1,4-benzoquinol methylase